MTKSRPRFSRRTVFFVTGAWALLLVGGFAALLAYQLHQPELPPAAKNIHDIHGLDRTIPGLLPHAAQNIRESGFAVTSVAGDSGLEESPAAFFFFHPNCPCTAATIAELETLLSQTYVSGRSIPKLYGFVYRPEEGGSWTDTASINQARGIRGLTLIDDPGAVMAKRFGAAVSGQVLMYSAEGRLVFNGGITESRGHQGENSGLDQLRAFLDNRVPQIAGFPVFGCLLYQI
jgi:hypothetical protein